MFVHCSRRAVLLAASALASSVCAANTLTANVADYNAAKVSLAGGALTVPANLVTYKADTTAVPTGSVVTVTLPAGFAFASAPSLTDSGTTTFSLTGGGNGSRSAQFTASTADLAVNQSFSLATFSVAGAGALATLTPVDDALPVTVQVAGIDAVPLSVGAFASEPGAQSVSVGAIQFIDTTPPVLGTEFGDDPANDLTTAVLAAFAISAQVVDPVHGVPVLNPDATNNSLAPGDTATFTMGGNWPVPSTAFTSTTSDCATPIASGSATATQLTLPNSPVGSEVFICITVDGVHVIPPSPAGFAPFAFSPGTSTDFLAGANNDEFPGSSLQSGPPLAPSIRASFSPSAVAVGSASTLTFTLANPNSCNSAGSGVSAGFEGCGPLDATAAFTNTFPSGLVVASPAGVSNTCGGTVTATSGSNTIALSAGTISGGTAPAGGTCTVSVRVLAQGIGTFVDTSGALAYSYTVGTATTSGTAAAAVAVLAAGAANVPAPALSLPMLLILGLALLSLGSIARRRRESRR